jgi:hypothetical protein
MKRLAALALLLSASLATPAAAQSFGQQFPATNTRYRAALGIPHLTTNGRDFFLFWSADRKTRATKLDGEARGGHVVLDSSAGFDVAWTGERFLTVSSRSVGDYGGQSVVIGRFLDADARPAGAEFTVTPNGTLPRIAAGRESVVVVYQGITGDVRALVLGPDGKSIGAESRRVAAYGSYAIAGSDSGFAIMIADTYGIHAVLLDGHGQTVREENLDRESYYHREIAVASDGASYLAAWSGHEGVETAKLHENTTFDAPMILDYSPLSSYGAPAVVWNGAGWSLAYGGPAANSESRAHVVHLDWPGQRIVAKEDSAPGVEKLSLAALDGRILAAWSPTMSLTEGASVVELPLSANQPRLVTYAATQQALLATAASAEATLIVWSENAEGHRSIRFGIRTNEGGWSERELTTRPNGGSIKALAASDGRNFAIVVADGNGLRMMRVDGAGRVAGTTLVLAEYPALMAWNGTHYALIGRRDVDGLHALLVTPAGQVAATVEIPGITFNPGALASDGSGFFLAGETQQCPFIFCYSDGLRATRLGPDLKRVDANDLEFFADASALLAGAVWNGGEYVMVWTGQEDQSTRVTRVPVSPAATIDTRTASVSILGSSVALMSDGSLAVAGNTFPDPKNYASGINRVVFLRKDGSATGAFDMDSVVNLNGSPRVTSLANGGVAYVASTIQDAPPYDGTSHVMMAIARPAGVPPPPEAPHVAARLESGTIVVDWTAQAGTLNGYRLEYRIDDGVWNEVDEWFPAGAHHTAIPRPSFGTNFAVRVRAFNDGGASAYSATALTQPSRRRAVR